MWATWLEKEGRIVHLSACALVLILMAAPLTAEAQPPKGIPRVGFLSSTSEEAARGYLAAFQQGLRELGYVEGENILVGQRYAGGQFEKLPALAADLARLRVDILVVGGAPAAHAAKKMTNTVPIVMTYVADPVATALHRMPCAMPKQ